MILLSYAQILMRILGPPCSSVVFTAFAFDIGKKEQALSRVNRDRASSSLCNNFGYHACADGMTAFTNGETHFLFHSNRHDQFDLHVDGVAWTHHFRTFSQRDFAGQIGRADVELGFVASKERFV